MHSVKLARLAAQRDEHRAQALSERMARQEKRILLNEPERHLMSSWTRTEWGLFFAAVAIATVLVGFIGPSELESQQGVVNVMRAATSGGCRP